MAHRRIWRSGRVVAVCAGAQVFVAGQSGCTPEGGFAGLGDAAAQAEQAIGNLAALLTEAGGGLEHVRRIAVHLTDRAWREAVAPVVLRHLGGVPAVWVIVAGLADPRMLVAIEADAVVPE